VGAPDDGGEGGKTSKAVVANLIKTSTLGAGLHKSSNRLRDSEGCQHVPGGGGKREKEAADVTWGGRRGEWPKSKKEKTG